MNSFTILPTGQPFIPNMRPVIGSPLPSPAQLDYIDTTSWRKAVNMSPRKQNGLTLIELIVVMAVLFILLLIAVPTFKDSSKNDKAVAGINSILGDLNLARNEAINRRRIITLCGSTNTTSCNTSQWESGWIVFIENTPANGTLDSGETILKVREALSPGITLRAKDFDDPQYIQYRSDGAVRDITGDGNSDGTFVLCQKDTPLKKAKAINVNNVGRASLAIDTNGDGIVNDINNTNISCP